MTREGTSSWLERLNPFKAKSDGQGFSTCVRLVIKPLRIFQFLVVLLIFVLVIYTIAAGNTKVSSVTCILLIVLSGIYVFILAIDMISQFSGGEMVAISMFLLSFLGVIFFGIAGILLIFVYTATVLWYIMTILCLCLLLSILFLIDAAMILAFWKRNCNQCCCTSQAGILYQKNFCHPLCETVKYDLTTSISSLRIPSGDEDATPDHTYRKVGYGRRRQYVDCPTSAPSASKVDVAEVQTEPRKTFHIESQTQRSVKEIPVQTVSRCEMCNQQMQIFSTTADLQATMQSAPCAPCPALVQLIRGVPCCPGCRCVAGIVQVPQQSQQQQTQRSDQDKKSTKDQVKWVQQDQKSYGMLTSEKAPVHQVASGQHEDPKMTEMAGTITKLTLASYCVTPSKKIHTSSQTTADDTKISKSAPTSPEEKKSKVNELQRAKPGEKKPTKKQNEILIPEREKTKTTNDVARQPIKSPPRKSISPLAQKQIKSSIKKEGLRKSVEFSAVEPVSILEEQRESTNEKLVSPAQQMAQVIDRLKEFEGSKMDELGVTTEEPKPKVDTTIKEPMTKLTEPEKKEERVKAAVEDRMKEKRSSPDETSAGQKPEVLVKMKEEKSETKTVSDATTVSEFKLGSRESSFSTDKSESGKREDSVMKQEDGAKVERGTLPEPKPDTGTQGTGTDASLGKSKRTHILRKKNKVEPAELKHADTDVHTLIHDDGDSGKPEFERLFVGEKRGFVDEKDINICYACKRLQGPLASSSYRFCSVYKDKHGRLYCEFCATANTIKVLYKDDGSEQMRLKCAGCRNFLRVRSSQSDGPMYRSKSDCPKCGQLQTRAPLAVMK